MLFFQPQEPELCFDLIQSNKADRDRLYEMVRITFADRQSKNQSDNSDQLVS